LQQKFVLLWFFQSEDRAENDRFERDVLQRPEIASAIEQRCVAVKLPTNASVESRDEQIALLDHPAFAELNHAAGLALIDMTDEASPLHRQVVSVYPFTQSQISTAKLSILLDLPRGTLTQRTLIFAVRTHPELP